MSYLSKQTAYDRIRKWFTRPNAQFGMDEEGGMSCRYRVNTKDPYDLRRCAIGSLIPPKAYSRDFEGYGPNSALEKAGYELEDRDSMFWMNLQNAHDSNCEEGMEKFLEALDSLARTHKLDVAS